MGSGRQVLIGGVFGIGGKVRGVVGVMGCCEGMGDLRVMVVVFLSILGIMLLFRDRMGINWLGGGGEI